MKDHEWVQIRQWINDAVRSATTQQVSELESRVKIDTNHATREELSLVRKGLEEQKAHKHDQADLSGFASKDHEHPVQEIEPIDLTPITNRIEDQGKKLNELANKPQIDVSKFVEKEKLNKIISYVDYWVTIVLKPRLTKEDIEESKRLLGSGVSGQQWKDIKNNYEQLKNELLEMQS